MPENDRKYIRDQKQDLTQNVNHDVTKLHDRVSENLQHAINMFSNDKRILDAQHDIMRRDLTSIRASELPTDVKAQESVRKTDLTVLDKFQDNQRNQLIQLQQLEKEKINKQIQTIHDVDVRQHQELETLTKQPIKETKNEGQIQSLKNQHQLEWKNITAHFEKQLKVLQEYRDAVKTQMGLDETSVQKELFAKRQGSDYQQILQRVFDKQKNSYEKLTMDTQNKLKNLDAQKAYNGRFSETPELNTLWMKAAENKNDFNKSRNDFWKSVNHDNSHESQAVREILKNAGYKIREGNLAPILEIQKADKESLQASLEKLTNEKKDVMKRAIENLSTDIKDRKEKRERQYLTLSIDHASPQSIEKNRSTDPSNLRFMLTWDNSVRGNRLNENDQAQDEKAYRKWLGLD